MPSYSLPISFVILLVVAVLFVTACHPTRVLNSVVPSGSYTVERDIPFGENERQNMDLYLPNDGNYNQDIMVFVYGGAWDQGAKEQFEFVGQAFARLGYITLIPNYRLYPEVEFPAFVDDVAMAIGEMRNHLPESCNLGDRIILSGHSAGAHTAALLAADPKYLTQYDAQDIEISALIALSGPYDLPLDHERVRNKFSKVEGDEANPIALANAKMPPTLLIHGEADTVAESAHAEKFQRRLESLSVPVTIKLYNRTRHASVVASLASPLRFLTPVYDDIQSFLIAEQLDKRCK
ncbi:alpha/beta hydrolase [Aliidiomarina iranensis]|uniref:Alpha/beta hydrolase n=1 Tax=Aliidiomarina iranensis TaxID=1434071 RepID=A0A432VW57_9GAMM|nr:alpha/beta hydrolase [Aliidiomarina iranensis]RUO20839.1 alpha/beta hydrolase [Aliidiomarina iranensis]